MHTTYYLFQNYKVIQPTAARQFTPLNRQDSEIITAAMSEFELIPLTLNGSHMAASVSEDLDLPEGYCAFPLRKMIGLVDDPLFRMLSKSAQLVHWHSTRRYCGRCGHRNEVNLKEMTMACPICHQLQYPVISPCIITLVHNGDSILLGRSPRFPGKMFSTLAGFIEPGETAEQAVHREIHEEVGIRVKNILYFSSQPWPFPGQLMLGFFAEFDSGDITIDGDEICQAGWFSIDNLPDHPTTVSISGQLIRSYLRQRGR